MDATKSIEEALEQFGQDFVARFEAAGSEQSLRDEKATVLGKKGKLTEILKQMGKIPAEDRKRIGERVNALKEEVEARFSTRLEALRAQRREAELSAPPFDLSLPARTLTPRGYQHPLTQTQQDLLAIFRDLGFLAVDGPEVETEENNFTRLAFPPDHPATDMQDTFWVDVAGGS